MSDRQILAGSTDQSVTLRIVDSTDGTPETGVVFNTTGIDLWYRRELAVKTSITEATLAALTTAHADGGFLEIGDGWYRLDLPDAAVASGVAGVQIGGTVTGMVVLAPYIELTTSVAQTGDNYARLGAAVGASISADLAAVKAETVLIVSDTNELQGDWVNGGRLDLILDARAAEASLPSNFSSLVISGAGNVDALIQGYLNNLITESTAGRIAANFDTFFENADAVTSSVVDDVGGGGGGGLTSQQVRDALKLAPTAGSPAAGSIDEHLDDILTDTGTTLVSQINGLNNFDPATDTVANVTLVATTSANTDMRGTDSALLAASVPTNFEDLAITNTTGRVDINTNNDKTGYFISGSITSLDGLNNISSAQVNTEMVDVIRNDTTTEVSGVPGATSTLSDRIGYLFAAARNKSTQTATTRLIRNDADSGNISSETVSDDGTTFIKGEAS